MWNLADRRRRRSDNAYQALCLQLEQTRRQAKLEAVVLAMDNGLVIAAAGETRVCEELGAVAPLIYRHTFDWVFSAEMGDAEVDVRTLACGGEEFYLASVGKGRKRDAALRRSMHGVHRILTVQ